MFLKDHPGTWVETACEGARYKQAQEPGDPSKPTGPQVTVVQTAVVAVKSDLDRKEVYLQTEPVGLDSMQSKRKRRGQNGL